jgi:ABC-2 type transport system permease protein
MLEYHLAEGLSKLTDSIPSLVGYLTGNGQPVPGDIRVYDLFENVLKPNYAVYTLNLNVQSYIPEEFKMVMMVKPTAPFSSAAKLKLDQYLMKGGRLLIFMDRLEAEMDSLQIKNQVVAYDRSLDLNDLLFRYGARVNPNLVMDLQCDYLPFDLNGNGQFQFLPWNYFPLFSAPQEQPITKGLGLISGKFVNSIDTIEADGVKKSVLLKSSSNARVVGSPALISGTENVYAPEDEKFRTADVPAAVLPTGLIRN